MRVLCLLICLASSAWAEFLRLEDVLRETDRHHPKLRAAALVREVAAAKTLEKQGAFDPSLVLGTEWLRYQSGSEPGKPKSAADNQLFYQVQDPYGWKLSAGYRLNRGAVKSPDSGTGAGGEYFLEFKLPLLRGAGINPKQTAVEVAREGELLAAAYQRAARLEVLLATALAYWDWVVAVQVRALVDANLRLAQDRLGQVQGRVKAGDLAPIEAVEAEQEVQRRQEALAKSQRDLEKAELKLGFYLWRSDGKPGGIPKPEAAPRLLEVDPATPDREQLAQAELHSLRGRPELLSLTVEQKIITLDRKLAENERLPILDLTLGPGYDTGFQSIGVTWKAGLQLVIPLATREADGRLLAAEVKLEKLGLDQVAELQRILLEVRDAHSALSGAASRYPSANSAWQLARRLEEAERLRFELGDSTLFMVNQRERQTLLEALKLLDVSLDYRRGEALLEAASGRLGDW